MVATAQIPQTLTTTYLEITQRDQFKPAFRSNTDNIHIERMQTADVGFYRYLYRAVGEKWRWRDRLMISKDELRRTLSSASTIVYVLYVDGAPAGYIELARDGQSVEIAYFGLREEYWGRGLGKHLLSFGVDKALSDLGATRVWVHTCNLDGPHALANYEKRGFRVYMQHSEPMPERYV